MPQRTSSLHPKPFTRGLILADSSWHKTAGVATPRNSPRDRGGQLCLVGLVLLVEVEDDPLVDSLGEVGPGGRLGLDGHLVAVPDGGLGGALDVGELVGQLPRHCISQTVRVIGVLTIHSGSAHTVRL